MVSVLERAGAEAAIQYETRPAAANRPLMPVFRDEARMTAPNSSKIFPDGLYRRTQRFLRGLCPQLFILPCSITLPCTILLRSWKADL